MTSILLILYSTYHIIPYYIILYRDLRYLLEVLRLLVKLCHRMFFAALHHPYALKALTTARVKDRVKDRDYGRVKDRD